MLGPLISTDNMSAVPTKSILKQSTSKALTGTDEQKAQIEKDKKNLNIALKHAYLIQHRKEVEAAILDSITVLLDFPGASRHTSEEAVTFMNLVKAFQPSDYDSLVEERRIDGRCGYVLCANPPRSKTWGPSAAWKLKKGMADWCSDACAKKGLYVKTQLSEVPAWERVPEQLPDINLHEDDLMGDDSAARRSNRTARVDEWRQNLANDEQLARERGERASSFRPNQVMADEIVENQPKHFRPSNTKVGTGHYSSIEGFQPKRISTSKMADNDREYDNN